MEHLRKVWTAVRKLHDASSVARQEMWTLLVGAVVDLCHHVGHAAASDILVSFLSRRSESSADTAAMTRLLRGAAETNHRVTADLLAARPDALRSIFEAHPENIEAWFSGFSSRGLRHFRYGAKALARYCLAERAAVWDLLTWQGRHSHPPVLVSQSPAYFHQLDVVATIRTFLARCPGFWRSEELADSVSTAPELLSRLGSDVIADMLSASVRRSERNDRASPGGPEQPTPLCSYGNVVALVSGALAAQSARALLASCLGLLDVRSLASVSRDLADEVARQRRRRGTSGGGGEADAHLRCLGVACRTQWDDAADFTIVVSALSPHAFLKTVSDGAAAHEANSREVLAALRAANTDVAARRPQTQSQSRLEAMRIAAAACLAAAMAARDRADAAERQDGAAQDRAAEGGARAPAAGGEKENGDSDSQRRSGEAGGAGAAGAGGAQPSVAALRATLERLKGNRGSSSSCPSQSLSSDEGGQPGADAEVKRGRKRRDRKEKRRERKRRKRAGVTLQDDDIGEQELTPVLIEASGGLGAGDTGAAHRAFLEWLGAD